MDLPVEVFGRPKAPAGTWGSCIRILDPVELKTIRAIELDNNEAAFSIAVVPFAARNNELFLCVGTASSTHLAPRSCTSGYIRTYAFKDGGSELELIHKVRSNTSQRYLALIMCIPRLRRMTCLWL